jgi:ABC-type sugar transport system permease subunit
MQRSSAALHEHQTMANRARKKWRQQNLGEWLTFLGLVTPNMVLFAVFTFWPIFFTFYLSFTDWNMIRPVRTFVGLENYLTLVQNPLFHHPHSASAG